ncbi:MAG: cytochrome P450 [Deltaproteobacteria bacterium]|nr:cytochrome P450 [Deltaproteobacteria bacterium]MBV8454591.1 cytochrome P450 [Deltaproteobacteria bacterium]
MPVNDTSTLLPRDFNPLSPETVENPYAFYCAMREHAPVYQAPGAGFFIVSRYEDAMFVLDHEELFSSRSPDGPGVGRTPETAEIQRIMAEGYPAENTLLTNDPPQHTRFRALVNKAFTPRRVATLEPSTRAIANELVDSFIGDGRVELVSQFAVGLPLTVIAEALGVGRADMAMFKRWSDDSVAPLGGMIGYERQLECARSVVEFQHYFAERLEQRRREPRDDLLTDLVNARLPGSESLTTPEMLSILQQLLVAGNETTTNLIASAMMLLLQNPEQFALVAADQSLIPNMIEEALRAEAPVQGLFRTATADTELSGVKIPAGARLVVMYSSANRDEREFPEAARFDVLRTNARTHLAFGHGIHFCLGAALARLEGRIAFETLLGRLRNLRFAGSRNDFTHTPSFILRGLKELHLEFEPVRS